MTLHNSEGGRPRGLPLLVPTGLRSPVYCVAQTVPEPVSDEVSVPVRVAPPPLAERPAPCDAVPVVVAHAEVVPGTLVVALPELEPPTLALPVVDPLTVVPLGVDALTDVPLGVAPLDVTAVLALPDVDPVVALVLAELPFAPAVMPAELVPPPLPALAVTVAGPLTLAPALALPPDGAVTVALAPPADALAPLVAADTSAEPSTLAL